MGWHRRSMAPFRQPTKKPKPLPPEATTWWWHPDRAGVRNGPAWFMEKLHKVDENLGCTWNAYTERWQIWLRRPQIQHKACWGWMLLFPVVGESGDYAPLDERVFHRLYSASARAFGSAKEYFNSVEREMSRAKEGRDRRYHNDLMAEADDWFRHSQIQVSMAGKSRGDKFSTYLS